MLPRKKLEEIFEKIQFPMVTQNTEYRLFYLVFTYIHTKSRIAEGIDLLSERYAVSSGRKVQERVPLAVLTPKKKNFIAER